MMVKSAMVSSLSLPLLYVLIKDILESPKPETNPVVQAPSVAAPTVPSLVSPPPSENQSTTPRQDPEPLATKQPTLPLIEIDAPQALFGQKVSQVH